jgi:fucose permease
MYILLLLVIYLAFISLGLPDSLLGSARPVMRDELVVPSSFMGIVTMIISGGTIISSLFSDKIMRRFSAKYVVLASIFLTAIALLGFSFSTEFWMLCLFAIPYGLGAGAIDAALNNYVALHYSSRHMSRLHCFWGVGALIGPLVMGYALSVGLNRPWGYRIISFIQIGIGIVVLISLPLRKINSEMNIQDEVKQINLSFKEKLAIRGVILVIIAFFAYCALESTTMQWMSTYLYETMEFSKEDSATYASLFFVGITIGRFFSGFISNKVGDKNMIRLGISVLTGGLIMLGFSYLYHELSLFSFALIGLGCAPIYPSIIHSTPSNFKKEYSQGIIGLEMASAYLGSTFMPPLFGLLTEFIDISWFTVYITIFLILLLVMSEALNKATKRDLATH